MPEPHGRARIPAKRLLDRQPRRSPCLEIHAARLSIMIQYALCISRRRNRRRAHPPIPPTHPDQLAASLEINDDGIIGGAGVNSAAESPLADAPFHDSLRRFQAKLASISFHSRGRVGFEHKLAKRLIRHLTNGSRLHLFPCDLLRFGKVILKDQFMDFLQRHTRFCARWTIRPARQSVSTLSCRRSHDVPPQIMTPRAPSPTGKAYAQ